jgi:folate-binding protein YgfZ
MDLDTSIAHADALAGGGAFTVLDGYARIAVTGADAVAWLNDLLTAEIGALRPGSARRSFLLTPTGRIKAEVRAIRRDDRVDLLERSDEPRLIAALLGPYVLSSDVALGEPEPVSIVTLPSTRLDDADEALRAVGAEPSAPSILGTGVEAVVAVHRLDDVRAALASRGAPEVPPEAAEILRIRRGIPRWRVDVVADSFPVGARVDDAVAHAKGCFLGQEAVAKIRNLGHPPTVLRHLETPAAARAADTVFAADAPVGEVTSAAAAPRGTVLLARVAHRAADVPLALPDGSPLAEAEDPLRNA